MDRLNEILYQKVIGVVEKLEVKDLENICNGNFDVEKFKAAGLDLNNSFVRELLVQNAKLGLGQIFMADAVEFNGLYFEKEASCDWLEEKILYSYEDSLKRVNLFGARHPYPWESFSLIIAWHEGKLTAEQEKMANNMLTEDNWGKGRGEWFGAVSERKRDRLIVFPEDSGSIEFDVKGIPSEQFVDLCRLP